MFTFNGKHSSEFGIIARSVNRPILPQQKLNYVSVPGRDGSYDFSTGNLEDRIIEIECDIVANSLQELQSIKRRLAPWLFSSGAKSDLWFDDDPIVLFRARVENMIGFDQLITMGTFTLTFHCEPFGYLRGGTDTESPTMDSDIVIDDYPYTVNPNADQQFSIPSSPHTLIVDNEGTAPVSPIIEIEGTFNTLSITVKDRNLTFISGNSGQLVEVDCEKMSVRVGSNNGLSKVSGKFLKLEPDNNVVSISGSGFSGLKMTFIFERRFY